MLYLFEAKDGEQIEREYPMTGDIPWDITVGGKRFQRQVTGGRLSFAPFTKRAHTSPGKSTWPLHSDAAAVHPSQIAEAKAFDEKHGVKTDYDKDGRPVFTSKGHRKRYCRAHGLHDRNGGYGDP